MRRPDAGLASASVRGMWFGMPLLAMAIETPPPSRRRLGAGNIPGNIQIVH